MLGVEDSRGVAASPRSMQTGPVLSSLLEPGQLQESPSALLRGLEQALQKQAAQLQVSQLERDALQAHQQQLELVIVEQQLVIDAAENQLQQEWEAAERLQAEAEEQRRQLEAANSGLEERLQMALAALELAMQKQAQLEQNILEEIEKESAKFAAELQRVHESYTAGFNAEVGEVRQKLQERVDKMRAELEAKSGDVVEHLKQTLQDKTQRIEDLEKSAEVMKAEFERALSDGLLRQLRGLEEAKSEDEAQRSADNHALRRQVQQLEEDMQRLRTQQIEDLEKSEEVMKAEFDLLCFRRFEELSALRNEREGLLRQVRELKEANSRESETTSRLMRQVLELEEANSHQAQRSADNRALQLQVKQLEEDMQRLQKLGEASSTKDATEEACDSPLRDPRIKQLEQVIKEQEKMVSGQSERLQDALLRMQKLQDTNCELQEICDEKNYACVQVCPHSYFLSFFASRFVSFVCLHVLMCMLCKTEFLKGW
jgi:hypothetical protein